MSLCTLCPRGCDVDRNKTRGFCGGGENARVARAALHFWEEPPISGTRGSGTVFFSGCTLKCVFCQNHIISHENFGKEVSVSRLADIFRELEEKGAHNINLVTPFHYSYQIIKALEEAKPAVPVAINCGGYEKPGTVRLFKGYASIFMPDLKCRDPYLSKRYLGAPDYYERACAAILEMHALAPALEYAPDGTLKSGLLVRHLVLPGARRDSLAALDGLSSLLPRGSYLLSLMSQFTPTPACEKYPEINRKITSFEYSSVASYAKKLGMEGFMQERSSASNDFVPAFDLTGV
ncbi:MAG: radical SAM protein [Clostridia bacterium]|nr:radical SAM protein [Clostridia bacterium]